MTLNALPKAVIPALLAALLACAGCSDDEKKQQKPLPARLYVCQDSTPNSVAAYEIAATGALTPMAGSPFATGDDGSGYGGQSNCIRIHVPSRRLYAVNDDSVSVFSIDEDSGALTLLPGSPSQVTGSGSPYFYSLEISGDGNTVFLPDNGNGEVIVASVGADGSLTEAAASPFTGSGGASVAELSRDGRFLYVQPEDDYLEVFSVGAAGLALLDGSPFATATSGFTLQRSHSGRLLAMGVSGLAIFALDTATGTPTAAEGTPPDAFDVGALGWAPNDARIYAAEWSTGRIRGYAVATNGALTALDGSPWDAGLHGSPGGLAISSDGRFLFMPLDGGGTAVYTLDAAGTPTELEGSPFAGPVGGEPSYAIVTP